MYLIYISCWCALVAELVDAADSKSVVRENVLVRVRPGAPISLIVRLPGSCRAPMAIVGRERDASMTSRRVSLSEPT